MSDMRRELLRTVPKVLEVGSGEKWGCMREFRKDCLVCFAPKTRTADSARGASSSSLTYGIIQTLFRAQMIEDAPAERDSDGTTHVHPEASVLALLAAIPAVS